MGHDIKKSIIEISREQILELYKAGPEAIIFFVENIKELINNLAQKIEEQEKVIEQLNKSVKYLEGIIKKDSHNSNKPPSSDGLKKSKKTSKRRKGAGKKPGGQKGHIGKTLEMVDTPDKIIVHEVSQCSNCGRSLKEEEATAYEKRQVFDIPPIKVEVTEHRAEQKECPDCGDMNTGVFPEEVKNKTQYGERLKANAVYLTNYGLFPYDRAAELFEDIFSIPLSPGTLVNINHRCSDLLKDAVEEGIKKGIRGSEVAHFDETGIRINGELHWLHVASTAGMSYFFPHSKRGGKAMEEIGILPNFTGTAVHDHWKSYFNYECDHSLCNAHHIRELTFLHEEYGQDWAKGMIDFLLEVKNEVDKAQGVSFDSTTVKQFEDRYKRIVGEGMKANPPPEVGEGEKKRGRKKKSKARNLLERLEQYGKETLAFMYDFKVPFDNNQGERDIRMMKVQQKISGTFRSYEGAVSFCRIRSYISTVKKQGGNVITAIQNIFQGNPFLPEINFCTTE